MQRSGATGADQGEIARIIAALDGDASHAPHHVVVDDSEDAVRRFVHCHIEGARHPRLNGVDRCLMVELQPASQ